MTFQRFCLNELAELTWMSRKLLESVQIKSTDTIVMFENNS